MRCIVALLAIVACSAQPAGVTALCGADAAIDAAPLPCHLLILTGQSNMRGDGRVNELSSTDAYLSDPYTPVDEVVRLANGTTNPPAWTEFPLSPTQPRLWASLYRFGIELTMARDLVAARPGVRWVIAKAAIGGTTLYDQWDPSNPSPSIFENVHDWIAQQAIATNCTPAAYLWIQGESDANQVSRAAAYGTNLTEYVNAVRARFGVIPFIYGRLNIATAATYVSSVRSGQEALSLPDVHLIDQDPYGLRSDGVHYTTPSMIALGHDYATAVLSAVP